MVLLTSACSGTAYPNWSLSLDQDAGNQTCHPYLVNSPPGAPYQQECAGAEAYPLLSVYCTVPMSPLFTFEQVATTGEGCYTNPVSGGELYYYCCGALSNP